MPFGQFKISFRDIVNQLSPHFFRAPIYNTWIYSLVKPLAELNDNGNPIQFFNQSNDANTRYKGIYSSTSTYGVLDLVLFEKKSYKNKTAIVTPEAFDADKWVVVNRSSFYQFTIFITRFLQVDSTTLKLQKYLNELFDSSNEGIIIVNNNFPLNVEYTFNAEEQSVSNFAYNAWDTIVDYAATNEFVLAPDGNVYESNTTPNVGNQPPSAEWDLDATATEYVFNEVDIFSVDYTIKIPVLVTIVPGYSDEKFQSVVNNFNAAGKSYEGIVLETSAPLFKQV